MKTKTLASSPPDTQALLPPLLESAIADLEKAMIAYLHPRTMEGLSPGKTKADLESKEFEQLRSLLERSAASAEVQEKIGTSIALICQKAPGEIHDLLSFFKEIIQNESLQKKVSKNQALSMAEPPRQDENQDEGGKDFHLRVETRSYSLTDLLFLLKEQKIRTRSVMLRRDTLVWSGVEKSRWIESVLLDLPSAPLWFGVSRDDRWLLYDGEQRLCTCRDFLTQDAFRLEGLEFLPKYEGKVWSELPRSAQRRILEGRWSISLLEKGTDIQSLYSLMRRLQSSTLDEQSCREIATEGVFTPTLDALEVQIKKEGLDSFFRSESPFRQQIAHAFFGVPLRDPSEKNPIDGLLLQMAERVHTTGIERERISQSLLAKLREERKKNQEKENADDQKKQAQIAKNLAVAAVGVLGLVGVVALFSSASKK